MGDDLPCEDVDDPHKHEDSFYSHSIIYLTNNNNSMKKSGKEWF
jgi:hypothetical protein